jgi:membrane protein YdbS with pleckstrin-like domain
MAFGRRKIPEQGTTYKTSRVSYISNYVLVILALVLLALIWPYLSVKIGFTSLRDVATYAIFALFVVGITFLMEEPSIEQIMRKYVVTNNEVIKVEGLLRKKRISIPHGNIADIRVKKGIFGRIFNFGDLEITGMRENISMKGLRNPDEIYRIIEHKVSLMREGFIHEGRKAGWIGGMRSGSARGERPGVETEQDLNE